MFQQFNTFKKIIEKISIQKSFAFGKMSGHKARSAREICVLQSSPAVSSGNGRMNSQFEFCKYGNLFISYCNCHSKPDPGFLNPVLNILDQIFY
jgi:hypothetical protein